MYLCQFRRSIDVISKIFLGRMNEIKTKEVQIELRGISKASEGRSCVLHDCCGKSHDIKMGDVLVLNHSDVQLTGK